MVIENCNARNPPNDSKRDFCAGILRSSNWQHGLRQSQDRQIALLIQ